MTTPSDHVPLFVVYLGVRRDAKDKKHFSYVRLPSAGAAFQGVISTSDEHWFGKQLMRGATPGSVWETTGKPDGSSITMNGRYVGRYADKMLIARWQAEDRALREEIDLESKQSSELRERLDLERLEPIRQAYAMANPLRRGLILASVVKFLTGKGSK